MLSAKYKDVALDMVFAVGPGALQFLLENRDAMARNAPIVFGGVSKETPESTPLPADVHGVVSQCDVRKTVDLALRLQPAARKIAFVPVLHPSIRNGR